MKKYMIIFLFFPLIQKKIYDEEFLVNIYIFVKMILIRIFIYIFMIISGRSRASDLTRHHSHLLPSLQIPGVAASSSSLGYFFRRRLALFSSLSASKSSRLKVFAFIQFVEYQRRWLEILGFPPTEDVAQNS